MAMDGELQLNITLPRGDYGRSKEKTAKQRKIDFEIRQTNKKKHFEKAKKKTFTEKVKTAKPEKILKHEKKDDNGYATSILRGEKMPTIHPNEGKLVFPHLALKLSDKDTNYGKNSIGKAKNNYKSGENTEETVLGNNNSKLTKKTGGLENDAKNKDESTSRSDLVSFVKKSKSSNDITKNQGKATTSDPTGKFLRKSKKGLDATKQSFSFAFDDSSRKTNDIEDTPDLSEDSVFQVDKLQMKLTRDADSTRRSQLRKRKEVQDADLPHKANKRRREDASGAGSDGETALEGEQRKAKKGKKVGGKNGDGDENADEGRAQWRGKFTSLFGSNPAIPAVPRRAVRPVQEPVFSSDHFSDLAIHKFLVSNLAAQGLTQLTTVQRKATPVVLAGRDALVRSQTGSGKTLAYALPLVELLQRQRPPLTRADGVRALVVLPTRELALQTYECFLKLVKPFMRLVPGYLVGGEKRKSEKARLRKGITILVGTPGRLLDHVQNTRSLRLDRVQYLVLDEADLLLDMDYERDIASIISELDSQSQPLLSKEVLEWNRKTYFSEQESPDESSKGKDQTKVIGYTSQDSGAGEEETSEEETRETTAVNDEATKVAEAKRLREEDETSDYDPEERADEVVLEDDEWEEDSSQGEEEEVVYRKEDDVWEVEDEGGGEGDGAGPGARAKERRRQTVLLSATLTPAVERLAGLALHEPEFVDAANAEADTKDIVIPDSLVQYYMVVPAKLRLVTLSAFILWKCKFTEERKMLLFCATQDMVDYLTELLTVGLSRKDTDEQESSDEDDDPEDKFNVGVDFFRLHGHMDHKERTLVFHTFRAADCGVLLCTDVAARGLDLPRVDWIVQLTAPGSVPDYVHRIGRTARVGAAGSALLFLLPAEADFVEMLQERRIRLQEEKMGNCLKKLSQAISSSEFCESSSVESAATALQLRYENAVLHRRSLHDSAVKAYVSFVRFYASYPKEVRDVFCFKALHLGHQAKSFALRDPPRAIAGIGRRRFYNKEQQQQQSGARAPSGKWARRQQPEGAAPRTRSRPADAQGQGVTQRAAPRGGAQPYNRRRMQNLVLSEFDSGLETTKKRKKPDYA